MDEEEQSCFVYDDGFQACSGEDDDYQVQQTSSVERYLFTSGMI